MANAPSKNVKSVNRWTPNPAPTGNEDLPDYLFRELNRLSDILFNIDVMRLEETHAIPDKPRNGDIRYAAGPFGTSLGANGLYVYIDDGSPAWEKL